MPKALLEPRLTSCVPIMQAPLQMERKKYKEKKDKVAQKTSKEKKANGGVGEGEEKSTEQKSSKKLKKIDDSEGLGLADVVILDDMEDFTD